MRILQLIQKKQYRGAEIFCCQLSNHLLAKGHEVIVVSIYEGIAILPFEKKVTSLNRQVNRRYFDIVGWKKLSKIISEFRPDIIQANAADTLKYTIFSKMFFKWKTPVIFRNASTSSYYIKDNFSKRMNSFLLGKVDLVISVSEASKRDINKTFPSTIPKSLVIPVGIEKFKLTKNNFLYRKGFKHLVHIGSFTKEKNHLELLNLFHRIKQEIPAVQLHLIGEGNLQSVIEKEVERKGLKNSVYFYGGKQNPLDFINMADVLLLPSLIEGLPAVILEAMYCKTPIVAYDVGGIKEVLNEDTGSIVKQGDKDGFVRTVIKIIKEPNQAQIENAFRTVNKRFLNKTISSRFLESYQNIIKKKRK